MKTTKETWYEMAGRTAKETWKKGILEQIMSGKYTTVYEANSREKKVEWIFDYFEMLRSKSTEKAYIKVIGDGLYKINTGHGSLHTGEKTKNLFMKVFKDKNIEYDMKTNFIQPITIDQAIEYEVSNYWLIPYIKFSWKRELLCKCITRKVKRKYNRYKQYIKLRGK